MIPTERQTITVTVNSVRFPRPDVDGRAWRAFNTDKGGCSGYLPDRLRPGDKIELTGAWAERNGFINFNFTAYKYLLPTGGRAELEYCIEHSNGLGPAALEAIWSEFGDQWRERYDDIPENTRNKLDEGIATLNARRALPEVLALLKPFGATSRKCEMICDHFNATDTKDFAQAPSQFITANPYRLCAVEGVGFKWCDEIALKMGVAPHDFRRLLAAIDHAFASLETKTGDSIHYREEIMRELTDAGIAQDAQERAVTNAIDCGRIVECGERGAFLASKKEVEYERAILDYAARNVTVVGAAEEPCGMDARLDEAQRAAVATAVNTRGLHIVTGAAGTGKTTIIRSIQTCLRLRGETVNVCAFAGKAAARVREASGGEVDAVTIHRMLRIMPNGAQMGRVSLLGQTVILDEASMVPNYLMAKIIAAEPLRLILVGDPSQLPPVGTGAPFHVLTRRCPSIVSRLEKSYRAKGAIYKQSMVVRCGNEPHEEITEKESAYIVKVKGAEDARRLLVKQARDGKIDFSTDVVITPRNGDDDGEAIASVADLNAALGAVMNTRPLGNETARLMAGDRVMCVKNHPDCDVWNGTCGWLREGSGGMFKDLQFENADKRDMDLDKTVDCKKHGLAKDLKPAWAMTVHKSQGSEYDTVYFVALKRDRFLFDAAMLYTAMTRAKRRLVILTDGELNKTAKDWRTRRTWLELQIGTGGADA